MAAPVLITPELVAGAKRLLFTVVDQAARRLADRFVAELSDLATAG